MGFCFYYQRSDTNNKLALLSYPYKSLDENIIAYTQIILLMSWYVKTYLNQNYLMDLSATAIVIICCYDVYILFCGETVTVNHWPHHNVSTIMLLIYLSSQILLLLVLVSKQHTNYWSLYAMIGCYSHLYNPYRLIKNLHYSCAEWLNRRQRIKRKKLCLHIALQYGLPIHLMKIIHDGNFDAIP
jgi:hypothetical protein